MGPETVFVLLLFALVAVPVLLGAVALLDRDTDDGAASNAELERRVEAVERRIDDLDDGRE